MTDSFQNWVIRNVQEVLQRQPAAPAVLLWCDPDRSWLDLLQMASTAAPFELWAPDSVDAENHELVLRDRMYNNELTSKVVWVPTARHDLKWFKCYELEAQQVWEQSLLDALREYGVPISYEHEQELAGLLPAHAREWFDKPKVTWQELTPGNAKGALIDDNRMLDVLAGQDGEFDRLVQEDRFEIFARRASEDFGLPNPTGVDEKAWRIESLSCLLCTDAAAAYSTDPPSEADKIVAEGLPRKRALDLLSNWQSHVRYIPSFESLVPKADATIGLTYWARNLPQPPRSQSSRAVEETLFSEAVALLDRLEDVDALVNELEQRIQTFKSRERGFWSMQATNKIGWQYLTELGDAACLIKENSQAEAEWKQVEDAFQWYTQNGWKLDWAGEQLFKERAELPKDLHRIRSRLRRAYLRTMDRIGRQFSELLSSDGESLSRIPSAGELLLAELERESATTAIFFLDACRFDIGYRLRDLLNTGEPEIRAHISGAVAPVPSITALGMAFALPVNRTDLTVEYKTDKKSFCVTAKDFSGDLKWAKERRKFLKEKFGCKDYLEITDVFDPAKLKKATKSRRLIAIHADELDSHDGQLKLTGADEHLKRYAKAIRRVRDAGFSRIVVVSDHGFFHWQPEEHEVNEVAPTGEILWKHRRAMVGHQLSHPTAVKTNVSQSELEILLPRSTSAFKTYGSLGFFHGGATLQELSIPVIVANWPVKVKKTEVVLKPVAYIASETPRIQIQAASTGQLSFIPDGNLIPRSVVVKVSELENGKLVFRHGEPVVIEPDGSPVTVQMLLVDSHPELEYGTQLVVQVIDADDEEILAREEVQLKIELSDW